DRGCLAIAVCRVLRTMGWRRVMTICAAALADAMPSTRPSIGAALTDTAQEVGTSVGTAVIGTAIAALVTTRLPAGSWSSDLVATFFHGERITYALLAVVVGLVTVAGARTLTDSRTTPEHPGPSRDAAAPIFRRSMSHFGPAERLTGDTKDPPPDRRRRDDHHHVPFHGRSRPLPRVASA